MTLITASRPASYATVQGPRVYNCFYDTETISFTLSVSGATAYEVRDYTGTVVTSGSMSGTSVTVGTVGTTPFNKYGWYRLRLTGTTAADGAYTTDKGTCSFVVMPTDSLIPTAPLRASNPSGLAGNQNSLDAPLAHGVFSLGGFRITLGAQRMNGTPRQFATAFTASGTSAVATLTGGGFNGAVTSASDLFVVHYVLGDSTGMTCTTSGYTLANTVTTGSGASKQTINVYRQFGAQGDGVTAPTVTCVTTNAAQHAVEAFEMQWVNDAAASHGQLLAATYSGSGASVARTIDMTSVAPGATEYTICNFVGTGTASAPTPTGGLSEYFQVNNGSSVPVLVGTYDSFGGGQSHSTTFTYGGSVNYIGISFAYVAVSTYSTDLTTAKADLDLAYNCWAQYADGVRPARQVTVATMGDTSAASVARYATSISQVVSDTFAYRSGLVGGYTGRNEPEFDYTVAESTAFKTAVVAGNASAKAFGPNYVSVGLGTSAGADMFAKADAGALANWDGISYHDYNMCLGDLPGVVRPIFTALKTGLASRSITKPIFMTEGGYETVFWPGIHRTAEAGSWYMLMTLAREILIGVPYERTYHYYDQRNGFDSVTTWTSSASGPYAGWAMQRTFAREVQSKTFNAEFDFGGGNSIYLGGLWQNPSTRSATAVIVGASAGLPNISAFVSGASSVTQVDCFGNTSTLTVTNNTVSVPVSHVPTYIRVPAGVKFMPRPVAWGSSQLSTSFVVLHYADSGDGSAGPAQVVKMTDADRTTPFAYSTNDLVNYGSVYAAATATVPRTVDITTPGSINVEKLAVMFPPPWQGMGLPIDFDIQVQISGTWTTKTTYTYSTVTVKNYDYDSDTMADCYSAPQHVFFVDLGGATTITGVRLNVRDMSYCMYMDTMMLGPTGNTNTVTNFGTKSMSVQSVEAYNLTGAFVRPLK